MEKWVIISSSCDDCGGDMKAVGLFNTEKEAQRYYDFHTGDDDIWQGICTSIKITKLRSPQ